ncbi:hypothetical protein PTTG_26528 [Puccinia triticina 1-1 BBBD Race 1]|uniref:Uncharacterized protein n=1 Tax=Puccinia triticina (isolate 1-1 / race 1 (BBBD)) TaxID=630390 RepID=A0A180GTW0_PUCT1|nr:hypothetical protein PTTG_26528 [Puccinia triticina 1-1 BBBD Race 1]WAR59842.1 hypothetical protein PtB15_11B483 [Puccinia triticina]
MRCILPFLTILLNAVVHLYVASPVLRGVDDQKSLASHGETKSTIIPDPNSPPGAIGGRCSGMPGC